MHSYLLRRWIHIPRGRPAMASTTQTTIDTLSALLRGELSAVETYRQVEEQLKGQTEEPQLRRMRDEHMQSVNLLREHIHGKGGEPSDSSGAWGSFASLVEGAAKAFGKTAALKALKEGEEQGIDDYESALDNPELPAECHALIRDTLVPRCRLH